MNRACEVNRNTVAEWDTLYATKESAERWTMWYDNDLVSKFCALLPREAEVLDVGCGAGFAQKLISSRRPDIRWHGCDFSPNVLRYLREHTSIRWESLQLVDVRDGLPYAQAQFQVVMCTELLEHLEDPESTVRELARITREMLVVSTPVENVVDSTYHIWSVAEQDMLAWLSPYGSVSIFKARADRQLVGVCRLPEASI